MVARLSAMTRSSSAIKMRKQHSVFGPDWDGGAMTHAARLPSLNKPAGNTARRSAEISPSAARRYGAVLVYEARSGAPVLENVSPQAIGVQHNPNRTKGI